MIEFMEVCGCIILGSVALYVGGVIIVALYEAITGDRL